jgi:hypothetical protein
VVHQVQLATLASYQRHARATAEWLARSFRRGGGSSAHFSLATGWSAPYPETTGYIIPTLLALRANFPELDLEAKALAAGRWLLGMQRADGPFPAGLLRANGKFRPSVFNTGQVLKGLVALHRHTGERVWLDAAHRGASWLARGVGRDGLWAANDYRAGETPSYYTHVAWPMLEVWAEGGSDAICAAARRFLERVLARRRENGAFARWGFRERGPAFTHTIAYTLRGLLESARVLQAWDPFGESAVAALEELRRRAELNGGSLPGALDESFRPVGNFVCLTGNSQTAINLLLWERREHDLRIVNAAAKLVDRVCAAQALESSVPALRGAVAGSSPVWGPYMRWRYPNWAAKYHADALQRLAARVERERERATDRREVLSCASS